MAVVQKARHRHKDLEPLKPWQEMFLLHDGRRELKPKPDFMPHWLGFFSLSNF